MTSLATAFAGLVFVLGLIFGLNWIMRRFGATFACRLSAAGKKSVVQVLESKPLDVKNRISLVRVRDREYVIVSGESNLVVESFDAMPDNHDDKKTDDKGA